MANDYSNWHAAAALDAARQKALMEHSGVLPHECPACAAHTLNKRLASLPTQPVLCDGSGDPGVVEFNEFGPIIHGCPNCVQMPLALPVDETFTQSEGLAGKADEVMKGILDGTLSRPKVKQIGDAVTERTKKDGGSDALGGAIGRSNRHGSFMGRRTPYSD